MRIALHRLILVLHERGGAGSAARQRRWPHAKPGYLSAQAELFAAGCNHANLCSKRPRIAHLLHVVNLVAHPELVEVALEHGIAVEVEAAALLGQQKSVILLRIKLGHLTQELVLQIVLTSLVAALALLTQPCELAFGDCEGVIDGIAEIGALKFLLQAVGLISNDERRLAWEAYLDAHNRGQRTLHVPCPLVYRDADACNPIVIGVQLIHPVADLL